MKGGQLGMNKFIKTCIIGGIIYVISDVSFQFGKGYILGPIIQNNMSGSQIMEAISNDKRLRVRFVKKIAELKIES